MNESIEQIQVLYVDGEPDCADHGVRLLEREDDRLIVRTATTVSKGLDLLSDDEFDCVISEFDLPNQNGIEFLKRVREQNPNLPFVLFTDKGNEDIASDAISAGVTDYVQKTTENDNEQYQQLVNRVITAVARQCSPSNYEEIFEKATDGIVLHDPDTGIIVDVNRKRCEMLGYHREELIGRTMERISINEPPYTEQEARKRIQAARDGEAQRFEWVDETKSGERMPVEVHLKQTTIGGQERVLALVRDISERKERERELERYKAYLEESTDIITVFDTSGTVKYESPAVTRILGYEQGELVGQNGFDFIHPEDREEVYEAFTEIVSEPGATATAEYRFRTADDEWRWLEARGTNQLKKDPINGIITSNRDITERKSREQELQQQNERLEEFASVVGHDLRNPLNVAKGRLKLAREECDSEHLESVARAHERMTVLIDDLLTLARAGEEATDIEPIQLADCSDVCWQNVETAEATLKIETNRSMKADRSQLQQLLENLFRNAVEHSGSDVTVTVGDLDDGFYVEDDGPGIPEEDRDEVFTAGYSTDEEGTGFGLSIVKQVIDAHNWEIDTTEGSEGGARFEITDVEFIAG